MANIFNFSDYCAIEPIYLNVFGKNYLVLQEIEQTLNTIKSTRNTLENEIKRLKEVRSKKTSDGENALLEIDNVLNDLKFQIELEEINIICRLGENSYQEIKEAYKKQLGEDVSYRFVKELSTLVTALATTGEPPKKEVNEVENSDNFQK